MTRADGASNRSWFCDEDSLLAVARTERSGHAPFRVEGYDDLREERRGGQGVVYRAVQRSTRQPVAIKVLSAGSLASPSQRRRFEREAELAASLRHPNIVRVFDGGVTPEGWPYIVMEFVEGRGLDERLRDGPMGAREAARLLASVCAAVHHAHQRGVIHRDLKPANIRLDPAGEPRVLDFGLATGDDSRPAIGVTREGQFLGSLPWASPEQVSGDRRPDVRSDIYSLGVMFYQMLTGRFPYDVESSMTRVIENIRNAEPAPPDSVAPTDADLRTIVLKCLAKEPERRYQTSQELLEDVRAYLAGEPIRARRDSAWYVLRRRAQRYRAAAWAGAVCIVAIGAGLGVASYWGHEAGTQRDAARQEAANLRQVNDFVTAMLAAPDPRQSGRDVRVAEVLDRAAADVGERLAGQPITQISVRWTIAKSYEALGLHEEALAQFAAAAALAEAVEGPESRRSLTSRSGQVAQLHFLTRHDEALALARATTGAAERTLGASDPLTLECLSQLATCLDAAEHFDEAEAMKRRLIDSLRASKGDTHPDTVLEMNNLGTSLVRRGRTEEGLPYLERVVEAMRAGDPKDPNTVSAIANLAGAYKRLGRHADAVALSREAHARALSVWGPEHPTTLIVAGNLGDALVNAGMYPEARELLTSTLGTQRRVLGDENERHIALLSNLGLAHQRDGMPVQAEAFLRDAVGLALRTLGPDHTRTATVRANLGDLLVATGRADEGASLLEAALGVSLQKLGPGSSVTRAHRRNLALAREAQGRIDDAAALLAEVYASSGPAGSVAACDAALDLARFHERHGDGASAAAWRVKAQGR